MTITALPPAPSRSDPPATFITKADALMAALPQFVVDTNSTAAGVDASAATATAQAAAALAQAVAAAASATSANSYSGIALAAANYKGTWASRTGAAAVPYAVSHLGQYWMLTTNIADITTKVPGTASEWAIIPTGLNYTRKTANYTASNRDVVLADTSAGAWTLTLPASPSVGDTVGYIDVAGTFGTNNLTVARNGQKIMGLSEDMTCSTPNEARTLVFDGVTNGWRIM